MRTGKYNKQIALGLLHESKDHIENLIREMKTTDNINYLLERADCLEEGQKHLIYYIRTGYINDDDLTMAQEFYEYGESKQE